MLKEPFLPLRILVLFCLFLGLMLPIRTLAQEEAAEADGPPPRYMDVNINGQMGIPLSTFKEKLSSNGYGLGGYFIIQIKREVPVQAGLEGGWQQYERESLDYTEIIGGQVREFQLATNVNIVTGHAVMRFQPTVNFPIWPFVDGLIGVKYIYTLTTLKEKLEFWSREQISADIDKEDFALSYGIGAGFQIGVPTGSPFRIEVRATYLPGASASYFARIKDASGPFNDPLEAFEERQSPTTILILQLGLTVDIGRTQ